MAAQKARSKKPVKRSARSARPRADGSKPVPAPPRRSGQGAGSAYVEMVRRQAQVPRVAPAADRERETRPPAPRRER
ncbi:hypothetical protein [Ramlibacter algicola]|uniref:Uncharacterized protein n=1 Tax=Ramlibacter algicola TaxID=2795217 RepID=A0A934Q1W5_9BURK|nr:hypothetical protein [Ramlibacter algicola]MBK0393258.1 hypothetical protein [Ramlibacter algicola]